MITKKTLKRYLLPLSGIIILALFIRNISPEVLSLSLREIGWLNLVILLSLTALNLLLKSVRWHLLIYKLAKTEIPLGFSFKTILAGIAGSSIIPGKIEITRPLMLKADYDVPLANSISSLSLERVMDLVSLLGIMTVSILFLSSSLNIKVILPALVAALIILILIFFIAVSSPYWIALLENFLFILVRKKELKEKIHGFLESFMEGLSKLEKQYLLIMTLFSMFINSIEIIRFYFLLQMIGLAVPLAAVGLAFTTSILIGVVTMIPGGVGITELSAAEIINALIPSSPKNLVTSSVLLDRVIAYYLLIAAGALILTFSGYFGKEKKKEEEKMIQKLEQKS